MKPWSEEFEAAVRSHLLATDADAQLLPNTTLGDLNFDSLSIMSIITALERAFKLTFPETALMNGYETTMVELWSHCAVDTSDVVTA